MVLNSEGFRSKNWRCLSIFVEASVYFCSSISLGWLYKVKFAAPACRIQKCRWRRLWEIVCHCCKIICSAVYISIFLYMQSKVLMKAIETICLYVILNNWSCCAYVPCASVSFVYSRYLSSWIYDFKESLLTPLHANIFFGLGLTQDIASGSCYKLEAKDWIWVQSSIYCTE